MSEGSNPGQGPGKQHDPLAQALEDLVAKRAWLREPSASGMPADRAANALFDPDSAVACPEPDEWTKLAGGEARAADAEALLTHAASCRECAVRLRVSLRPLAERASFEESAELAGLASSSPAWQRERASELAKTAHRPVRRSPSRLFLWGGLGLAALLIASGAFALWWQRAHAPEHLLAEAYGHSRIFALRMPGAPYAEVSPHSPQLHLRSGATGLDPARLLEARARIETLLEVAPHDPHWLQLEARADVLQEQFDPAIDILDRLVASGPVTAGLLADDAVAYFQRGAATGSQNDRSTALDYLRRADELAPGDPVVLFNEAVVMEDCGQVMNAVETWNRYSHFERDIGWLAEGQGRLRALEQRLNRIKTR